MEAFIEFWREWGAFISLLVTLGVIVYLFTRRSEDTPLLIYKVVSVMAIVLSMPAIMTSPLLNLSLTDQLAPTAREALVWLSVVAGAVSLLLLGLALFSVGIADNQRTEHIAPIYDTPAIPPMPMAPVGSTFPEAPDRWSAETELDSASPRTPIMVPTGETEDTYLLRRDSRSEYFAWLVELVGPRAGTTYPVGRERNIVGRSAESHIRLEDSSISSQHAALLRDKQTQRFILHDLASSNGTLLHDERIISPRSLRDGDIIQLGRSKLYFMEVRPDEVGVVTPLEPYTESGQDQVAS